MCLGKLRRSGNPNPLRAEPHAAGDRPWVVRVMDKPVNICSLLHLSLNMLMNQIYNSLEFKMINEVIDLITVEFFIIII